MFGWRFSSHRDRASSVTRHTLLVFQVAAALFQRWKVAEGHVLCGTMGPKCVELPRPHQAHLRVQHASGK